MNAFWLWRTIRIQDNYEVEEKKAKEERKKETEDRAKNGTRDKKKSGNGSGAVA